MPHMVRIAAYCRVSTDKNDQLNSLENQKTFFEKYAAENNCRLVKIYADEGLSGTTLKNRKELRALLVDAHENLFDRVVIKDISRLARNAIDFLTSVRELKAIGISCKFVTSNLSTEDGELILGIMALVAQEESASLSKRVKFGKQINAQKGRVPNRILGYNRIDNFHLSVNETEADIIRLVFKLYTVDKYGIRKICAILAEKHIRTRFGNIWYPSTVRRILSNSIYCGRYENNKWETKDFIEKKMIRRPPEEHFLHNRPEWAIVSEETFDLAQNLLAQHSNRKGKTNGKPEQRYSNAHIFSNLIRCKVCGCAFIRKEYKNKNALRVYWKCKTRDQKTAASCANATTLDEADLFEGIRTILAENANISEIKDLAGKKCRRASGGQNTAADVSKQKADLRRIERTLAKYQNLYLEDMLGIEELKQKTTDLKDRMNAIKTLTNDLAPDGRCRYEEHINQTASDVLKLINISNDEMRMLIEHIEVDKNGETVIFFTQL